MLKLNDQKVHWADITADQIIRERGEKELYVCASGITPSGVVHIGNFREIISVELVVRALREKGKSVRFIYSWDDYDVFRKVPANMPQKELLEQYLRKPIILVPDVLGDKESYAEHNEKFLEESLAIVGVHPHYIYQSKKYRASEYAEGIVQALKKREIIRESLNEFRTTPLPDNWWPVGSYCESCDRDETEILGWDGEYTLTYKCHACGKEESVNLKEAKGVKLPWRIDWPMRWNFEDVDFEPAGKEHHSAGGSFDTARVVAEKVYNQKAPVTFKYDFVTVKGTGGKMSSSLGNVLSLKDVLEIYQPEIIRYLFAGTRPNTEFAISFDLDVLKIYEDYDRCEQNYFEKPQTEKAFKKWAKSARIYELSQVEAPPSSLPYQIPIRHLCNLLQINDGNIEKSIASLGELSESDRQRVTVRAKCAWNWITNYAPDEFIFRLRQPDGEPVEIAKKFVPVIEGTIKLMEQYLDQETEKEWSVRFYDLLKENSCESKDIFPTIYRLLLNREKGPRLIPFLYTIGKERSITLLKNVREVGH